MTTNNPLQPLIAQIREIPTEQLIEVADTARETRQKDSTPESRMVYAAIIEVVIEVFGEDAANQLMDKHDELDCAA
jgi:hypothetical protein